MKKGFTIPCSVLFLILLSGLFSPAAQAADSSEMVGPNTCKACHRSHFDSYSVSIHARKAVPNSPANKFACESCHGPGAGHVEKFGEKGTGIFIFSKKIEDARAKSAKCLACHGESKLAFWDLGRHNAEGLSCDNCHTIHSGAKKNLKAKEPDLCNICHRKIAVLEGRQSHHPIKEGRMKCTNCHEQHGGFGPKMVKANSANDLCYKCHMEKRGPFLWEHPPVEENCLTCHTPHGSNHSKLLTNRVPFLCQSCHNGTRHPTTAYTSFETFEGSARSNRMFSRACLNCHSNIHGSNAPSVRGQRFVR